MQHKSLPDRPSLEQFKKRAKELVKEHRNKNAETFALIRKFLPSLTQMSDEQILLYPFALHDAQSVIARQYGFNSWNHLRDELEASLNRLQPESSIGEKFQIILRAKALRDYDLYSSVMSEGMRVAVPRDKFLATNLDGYLKAKYTTTYMGELIRSDCVVYFWRLSAPGQINDILCRMAVKDDLVTGMLFSGAFN